jgi:hypothetical protein
MVEKIKYEPPKKHIPLFRMGNWGTNYWTVAVLLASLLVGVALLLYPVWITIDLIRIIKGEK